MAQKLTLTGTPTSELRSVGDIFNFDMTQSTKNVPKGLPMPENPIVYTVFINQKQKTKLSTSKKEFPTLKLLVQGEPTLDIPVTDCPGEIGVLCMQIERIPNKDKQQKDETPATPETQEKNAESKQPEEKESVASTTSKRKKKKGSTTQEVQQAEKVTVDNNEQDKPKETPVKIDSFMDISKIEIPVDFAGTPPSPRKIAVKKEDIQRTGQLTTPLVISKEHVLLDGYAWYLASLELGINEVPVHYKELVSASSN